MVIDVRGQSTDICAGRYPYSWCYSKNQSGSGTPAGLNRDTEQAANVLSPVFNKEKGQKDYRLYSFRMEAAAAR